MIELAILTIAVQAGLVAVLGYAMVVLWRPCWKRVKNEYKREMVFRACRAIERGIK